MSDTNSVKMNSVSDTDGSNDLAFDEDGSDSIRTEEEQHEERRVTSRRVLIIRLTLVKKVRKKLR